MPLRNQYGCGALDRAAQVRVLAMLETGLTQQAVATQFGVSKNTIAGLWHRQGSPNTKREPSTLWTRCEKLHAHLDAVLAANLGVGRIPGSERPR